MNHRRKRTSRLVLLLALLLTGSGSPSLAALSEMPETAAAAEILPSADGFVVKPNARQMIIYVDTAAPGPAHNGFSWTTAFTEVQSALAVAPSGYHIWVAAGVYYPDYDPLSGAHTGLRTATFELTDGVALYGGFAGGESDLSERDWSANPTVLSGDIDRNDLTDPHGVVTDTAHISGTNAYTVVTSEGVTATTRLHGFIITAGNADDDTSHYAGGGMRNASGSPVLVHVTFIGNSAYYFGGGLSNSLGSVTLIDVTFSGNTATYGGGIFNSSGNMTLTNVTFNGNQANNAGGGMMNTHEATATLINVTFGNNQAQSGGGMYNHLDSNPTLINTILWGNTAPTGAQIRNTSSSIPTISYSDVQDSGGSGAGWDGALGVDGGGNIDADPLFVDAAGGNLRLRLPSPAIDAGNNYAVPPGVTTDLDGKPRFVDVPSVPDTGLGDPPIVDMGAYEVQWDYPYSILIPLVLRNASW